MILKAFKNLSRHWRIFLLALLFSGNAWAAETVEWKSILIVVFILAGIGAYFLMRRTKMLQSFATRLIGWGAYFWVLVFVQGIFVGAYFAIVG